MNKYLICISYPNGELDDIFDCVDKNTQPTEGSFSQKIRSEFKDWEASFEAKNVGIAFNAEDENLEIYFESPQDFIDDIDHDQASDLYMNFRDLFKYHLIKLCHSCGVYDKNTGIQWDWDKEGDDSFDWYKEDVDHDYVDKKFDDFKNLYKLK